MEFKVIEKKQPVIKINIDEINALLDTKLEVYSNLIVTEETLPACKESQRELASLRISVEKESKPIIKTMLQPINEFKDQCKLFIEKIRKVEDPLKSSIEKFNDEIRRAKAVDIDTKLKAAIVKSELDKRWYRYIDLNPSVYNMSATKKSAEIEIQRVISEVSGRAEADKANREAVILLMKDTNESFNPQPPVSIGDIKRIWEVDEINIIEVNRRINEISKQRILAAEVIEQKAIDDQNVLEFNDKQAEKTPEPEPEHRSSVSQEKLEPSPSKEIVISMGIKMSGKSREFYNDIVAYLESENVNFEYKIY